MKKLMALVPGLVALAVAGSASADSTIKSGYGGVTAPVGDVMQQPKAHVAGTVATKGTLPFTGLNLATFVVIALLLIAIGFAVTRMSRRGDSA